jgi:membrane protease YdiL (CAAX protease family)
LLRYVQIKLTKENEMKTFLIRYQVVLFFLLTLFIGYLPWWGLGTIGFFAGGMTLAGLIIVAIASGRKGLGEVLRRYSKWRVNWRWYALAMGVPALVSAAAVGINVLLGGQMPGFGLFRTTPTLLLYFILALFFPWNGPVGEELFGLRGYAQPQLQKTMRPLFAALIVGTFFGAWHFPEFFRPGSSQHAIGFALYPVFILVEIAHSSFQAWIYNRSGGSSLVGGTLVHASYNFWSSVILIPAFSSTAELANLSSSMDRQLIVIWFAIMIITGAIVIVATKGRLGLKPQAVPDGRQPGIVEPLAAA